MKNGGSSPDHNLLSNLTNEQIASGLDYNGKAADMIKSTTLETIPISERYQNRQNQQKTTAGERPQPMRPDLIDDYCRQIADFTGKRDSAQPVKVFKNMIRHNMDNRIFNNLKQQLNDSIDDEKSLLEVDQFKKMFNTYFKADSKADIIYEDLLPCILVWYNPKTEEVFDSQKAGADCEARVSI